MIALFCRPPAVPMSVSRRLRPAVLAVLLAVLASACSTLPTGRPVDASLADRAEQLYRDGQLDESANLFLNLAEQSRADAAAHYRLRAAEVLRDAGRLDAAAQAIADVRRRRLGGDEPLRLDLLDAEIALSRGDAAHALDLLNRTDGVEASEALQLRVYELRARAQTVAGDRFAAARTRAAIDARLSGADRDHNRAEIIDTLSALEPDALIARAETLQSDDPLLPWIEQALRRRGSMLPRQLPQANRPVGTLQADDSGALHAEGYRPLRQVALLLPVSGPLGGVAQSIRDGFFTAYFADASEQRPSIRVYDSGDTPAAAVAAYQKAVADGADHVVGPLQRESVGELFRQPLPARVLALNHPDSGEVPPPGNAEFGLLPDAEGAQAAQRMIERGIVSAAVIAAKTDWAERAALAFRTQFEAAGGRIVGESRLLDNEVNYRNAITQATAQLAPAPDGGVFISMRPQQARLLVPQLQIAGVTAPVFGTSHIYSGDPNSGFDRDLNQVEFCDAPWLSSPVPGRPDRGNISNQIASANGVGARLFAFGMDAYALLPYLGWMLQHSDQYIDGATGQLTADSFGRIHRRLGWMRFENGIARPAQGVLSSVPAAPVMQ